MAKTIGHPSPDTSSDAAAPFAALEPGVALGPYLIISRLGESGMVYKAQDNVLNRIVALKILPPWLLRNGSSLQRFRREAQAQARLNNPNVVALHSMLDTDAGLVLAMEYLEGQTLAQHIRNHGALPIDKALWIFEQALHGVERAHAADIVHRDLKPASIFITHDRRVKIMGFGLAKMRDQQRHSLSGVTVGTLLYTSPEQVNGQDVDVRSDIYTLGISLFEALTGRLPFQHSSDYALMNAHLKETPPNPRALRQTIPAPVEAAILKAIEKDPTRRFQSARAFRLALIDGARLAGIELSAMDYDDISPQTAGRWRERTRNLLRPLTRGPFLRMLARRRALGMALDATLLLIVVGLILSFSLRQTPTKSDGLAGAPTHKSGSSATPRPSGADAAGDTIHHRPAPPADADRKPDKYESLRKAWGG